MVSELAYLGNTASMADPNFSPPCYYYQTCPPAFTPPPYAFHPFQPEYTPPPTPPYVYHHIQPPEPPYQFNTIPQPPSYYTPPTSYTSPYLSDSSGIPCYSTNQHEIQARPNPYHPPLTCFTSPFITTTQFPFGVIDEQQPELVVSQVFDESPHSPELIFNSSNDNNHQMYDKFSEIIQKLEEIGKNLADQSRISKEMPSKKVSQSSHTSKKVSQSSHTLTHVPIVGNLDKSAITEKTGNVDSKQQLDILAPHMFDESPENEYVALDKHFPTTPCAGQVYSDVESSQPTVVEISVESLNYDNRVFDVNSGINVNEKKRIMKLFNDHDDTPVSDEDESKGIANEVWKEIVDEKSGDSTFEGSYDESESPRQIVDFSKGKLDSIRRNRSSGGMLAVNSVFVGVKTVGFENEEEWGVEEIERKDIKDWKVLKSKYTLALRSVDVKRNLDEGKGRSGKVLEVSSLKEVLEDDDMRKNEENNATEESKNSGDQSCEAQYVLPKINLDDLSIIVCDRILIIFDPGGYKRNVACVVILLKEMNRSSEVGLDGIAKVISSCSVVNVGEDMGSMVMNQRERFESKKSIEGGSATHDCFHFVTLIGDLKSIKKIYDEMYDTYNEDKNARISVMGKQKYVGESFEVFDYMYKKHLYSWNLRMTRYGKMRNMEPAQLFFDDSLNESSYHLFTERNSEAYSFTKCEGWNCRAIFGLLQSLVWALQFFYFDLIKSPSTKHLDLNDFRPLNIRYDAQLSVFEAKLQKILDEAHVFVVGYDALGCELMENSTLMGASCDSRGKQIIIDDDVIERSNLSRQISFRDWNIGQVKSSVAATVAGLINPSLNIKSLQTRVGPEMGNVLDNTFWENPSVGINNRDTVNARLYVDQKCLYLQKPKQSDHLSFHHKGVTYTILEPIGTWGPEYGTNEPVTTSGASCYEQNYAVEKSTWEWAYGKEMIAYGVMNIAGSCTSCYIITGSSSHTADNFNAVLVDEGPYYCRKMINNYRIQPQQYKSLKKDVREIICFPRNCLTFLQSRKFAYISCSGDENSPTFSTIDLTAWGVIIRMTKIQLPGRVGIN